MTPEEVARHHAERPGYELVDYAEVALPLYKIYVVASLLQHTPSMSSMPSLIALSTNS